MTVHFASTNVSLALPLAQSEALRQLIQGLFWLMLVLVVGACLIAFVILLTMLLPGVIERNRKALLDSPGRAFFIGLANYIFLGGISLLLFAVEIPPLGALGLLVVSFLTVITFVGLPGLAKLVGERLATAHNPAMSSLRQTFWGMITITLAGLLPFVGWFLLTPILLMVSFGAAVLGWLNRRQPEIE